MKRLAVFISKEGTGSNLQALIDAIKKGVLDAQIQVVVSDHPDATGVRIAKSTHIPVYVFQKGDVLSILLHQTFPVDYIVLAGWKKIIPDELINAFENRILNIHPGLIPDSLDATVLNPDGTKALWNRGKYADKAIQNFLDTNATYAGSSIHFLTDIFDFGPVAGRVFEKIKQKDTIESLYKRLKKKEHILLITSLQQL